MTPARLGIVTFRLAGPPATVDERSSALVPALRADGFAVISSTQVNGRIALRLCTNNPRTTTEDIEATIARLGELAEAYGRKPRAGFEPATYSLGGNAGGYASGHERR